MAILTVGTPTPEDHFWHILRTIDPVVTALRAYTEDQRNVLSKDHTSDALYLIQALITSLQLDPEAQATVRDSGECRAEPEERPSKPLDQTLTTLLLSPPFLLAFRGYVRRPGPL